MLNNNNNNLIKGSLYEKQIKEYIINNLNKQAYLWSETPETILIENGIIVVVILNGKITTTIKKYIDENNKKPSNNDENDNISKLSRWLSYQIQNCRKNDRIMKKEHIRKIWNDFVNSEKYKNYFTYDEEEKWINNLNELKKYINDNQKKPSERDIDEQIKKISIWMHHQQDIFKKKIGIMKNQQINDLWNEFVNSEKYKKYFLSNEQEWLFNLDEVKKYIYENNKRPSEDSKDKDIKRLGKWLSHQQQNYKNQTQIMSNEQYRNEWENFVNSDEYKKYFMTNIEEWENNLNLVKKYIDTHNKKPSSNDNDKNIKKLGYWIGTQKGNYKKQNEIMKKEEIRAKWKNFIESEIYSIYFN